MIEKSRNHIRRGRDKIELFYFILVLSSEEVVHRQRRCYTRKSSNHFDRNRYASRGIDIINMMHNRTTDCICHNRDTIIISNACRTNAACKCGEVQHVAGSPRIEVGDGGSIHVRTKLQRLLDIGRFRIESNLSAILSASKFNVSAFLTVTVSSEVARIEIPPLTVNADTVVGTSNDDVSTSPEAPPMIRLPPVRLRTPLSGALVRTRLI